MGCGCFKSTKYAARDAVPGVHPRAKLTKRNETNETKRKRDDNETKPTKRKRNENETKRNETKTKRNENETKRNVPQLQFSSRGLTSSDKIWSVQS